MASNKRTGSCTKNKYYKDGKRLTQKQLDWLWDNHDRTIKLNAAQKRQLVVLGKKKCQQSGLREIESPDDKSILNPGYVYKPERYGFDAQAYSDLTGILDNITDLQREIYWEEFHKDTLSFYELLVWTLACFEGLGRYVMDKEYFIPQKVSREALNRLKTEATRRSRA